MDPPTDTDTERALRKDLLLLREVLEISQKAPRLAEAARKRERTYEGYWSGGYGPRPEWGRRANHGAQYFYVPRSDGPEYPPPAPDAVDASWVLERYDDTEFWTADGHWDGMGDRSDSWCMAREATEMAEKWEEAGRRAEAEIPHLTARIATACRSRDPPSA